MLSGAVKVGALGELFLERSCASRRERTLSPNFLREGVAGTCRP
jgi:hypothetical protein